jgi:hypothetical protein
MTEKQQLKKGRSKGGRQRVKQARFRLILEGTEIPRWRLEGGSRKHAS